MALPSDRSYRPKDTESTYAFTADTHRRRMAIDSVLNPSPSDSTTTTTTNSSKHSPSTPYSPNLAYTPHTAYSPSLAYTPPTAYSPRPASTGTGTGTSTDRSRQSSSSADSRTDYHRATSPPHHRPSSCSSRSLSHSRASGRSTAPSRHGSRSARERREMRPTYQQEEEYFIWYHRVDLGLDWRDVRAAYNAQFPARQRRGFQGIQCKYYRCCETHGIPRVRERNRGGGKGGVRDGDGYGVRQRLPGLWYPWMERRGGMGVGPGMGMGMGDSTKERS